MIIFSCHRQILIPRFLQIVAMDTHRKRHANTGTYLTEVFFHINLITPEMNGYSLIVLKGIFTKT